MIARSAMPRTALADAFLAVLLRWVQRQTRAESITLPVGAVDPLELRQVVVALVCARNERSYE
jgi:hypothetical protein